MTSHASYREMNEAQRLAWGVIELQARDADLAGVRSAAALEVAQAAAKMRRKAISASRGQAASMVLLASENARAAAKATGSAS